MSQATDQNKTLRTSATASSASSGKEGEDDLYKIGTVAKLTGVAVERLRAWERRYGLTPASREGKTRYFSGSQVERLTRIKRLIDQGHPVSTLINLDEDALNERLQLNANQRQANSNEQAPAAGSTEGIERHKTRVGLIGTQLLMLEQTLTEAPQVEVTARWVNLSVALAEIDTQTTEHTHNPPNKGGQAPDILVVLLGSLTPDSLKELEELPINLQPVVVYHYATEPGLAAANDAELQLLRWPARWSDIENAVARQTKSPLRASRTVARRFSDEQLLSIATASMTASTATAGNAGQDFGLGCSCPADLVNLISALNAFSDHADACRSNLPMPLEDDGQSLKPQFRAAPGRASAKTTSAALTQNNAQLRHAQIAQRTSEARLELELVLEDWVIAEGLLPVPN